MTEAFIKSMDCFLYDNGLHHERVKEEQHRYSKCQKFELSKQQLNLKLSEEDWKFKLSRAPWWGGQFERMVGLVRLGLYKATGRANLSQKQFEEIVLDIEVTLNNQPLMYVEEDIKMPVLTPNTLLYGQPLLVPEEDLDEDVPEMKRRQRYINKCKDEAWTRWTKEYLNTLRERYNMFHQANEMQISLGDIVLIKGDEKHSGKWNIGMVDKLYRGKYGVIRAVGLRASKSYTERPIQYLYPLELHCDVEKQPLSVNTNTSTLDANAKEYRPRRTAAAIAEIRMKDINDDKSNNDHQQQ